MYAFDDGQAARCPVAAGKNGLDGGGWS